jgi:4-hydroxybenzoate polyprenyltransferase
MIEPTAPVGMWGPKLVLAVLAVCLLASTYYVLNELLDADCDRHHPDKRHRVMVVGAVSRRYAVMEMLLLGTASLALSLTINKPFAITAMAMLLMGLAYNLPPLRLKDRPIFDVLCEAANSPLRILLGWLVVPPQTMPPPAMLGMFWCAGGYLMSRKRHREYRRLQDPVAAAAYRRSFQFYNEPRLVLSMWAYAGLTGIWTLLWLCRDMPVPWTSWGRP